MPLIEYKTFNFRPATLERIGQANEIIDEYAAQGFDLTLRQIYYQFVARDLIPNTQREYKKLGSIINDARLAGMIDWDAISDRTRELRENNHWTDPSQIMRAVAEQFMVDKWMDQENRIEVWIEKDALIGVIEGVCNELDVPHFSCRGYVSQSEMWAAAQRMLRHNDNNQSVTLLHLGDHDPSGIDMSRDIADRLALFGVEVNVDRIALNMPQVEEHQPPPNPAKITDSRSDAYISQYGDESWELDALDPATLAGLITDHVTDLRDEDTWDASLVEEEDHKRNLNAAATRWHAVVDYLNENEAEEEGE